MRTFQNTVVCSLAFAATAAALPTWSDNAAGDNNAPMADVTGASTAWPASSDTMSSDWGSSGPDASATGWPAPSDTMSSEWGSSGPDASATGWPAPSDTMSSDWGSSALDASATGWPAPADTAMSSDWSDSTIGTDASATGWPAPDNTAVSSDWASGWASTWASTWSTSIDMGASATIDWPVPDITGSATTEATIPTDVSGGCAAPPPPPPPPPSDCSAPAAESSDSWSAPAADSSDSWSAPAATSADSWSAPAAASSDSWSAPADNSGSSTSGATDSQSSVTLTNVTHTITVGFDGKLIFDPENVVAEIGDIVRWEFLPNNHSIARSSFDEPCKPLAGNQGFAPGFQFATKTGKAPNVFEIVVEDKNPQWFYCPQTNGNHCQMGMAGVINQNFDGNKTLANYKKAAASTVVSVVPDANPNVGTVKANPNP